jgi:hypothetical protein
MIKLITAGLLALTASPALAVQCPADMVGIDANSNISIHQAGFARRPEKQDPAAMLPCGTDHTRTI